MKKSQLLILVGLTAAAVTGTAFAAPKDFTITNGTHATVVAVQVRPTGTRKWTPVLQRQPLSFKRSLTATLDLDNCPRFDIQVLFDDGHRTVTTGKRLCPKDTFTVAD